MKVDVPSKLFSGDFGDTVDTVTGVAKVPKTTFINKAIHPKINKNRITKIKPIDLLLSLKTKQWLTKKTMPGLYLCMVVIAI